MGGGEAGDDGGDGFGGQQSGGGDGVLGTGAREVVVHGVDDISVRATGTGEGAEFDLLDGRFWCWIAGFRSQRARLTLARLLGAVEHVV